MGSFRRIAPALPTPDWSAHGGIDADEPPFLHRWQCEIVSGALCWSDGVFALFGLPIGVAVDRRDAVAMYAPRSRAILERVRTDAIARCTSFTVEARIFAGDGVARWLRITGDVACGRDGRAQLLHGTKQDISREIAAGQAPFLGPLTY